MSENEKIEELLHTMRNWDDLDYRSFIEDLFCQHPFIIEFIDVFTGDIL